MFNLTGTTLGKYQIVERIGRGGMAEVYRGIHPRLGSSVAIKVLYSHLIDEEDFLARFEREAKGVAGLRHPNIVRVFDFDVQDELYFMVMDYINGMTLKKRLYQLKQNNQTMDEREMLVIFRQIADALQYAHQQNMVHRDVKSGNIMLEGEKAYLTDFGVAHMISSTQFTATGALIGTPIYMSPEQCKGDKLTPASDIYSLGMILFEMATGQVPFEEDTPLAIIHKHIYEELPSPSEFLSGIDAGLEKIILKALSKEPTDRYADPLSMARALYENFQLPMEPVTMAGKAADIPIPEKQEPEPEPVKTVSETVIGGLDDVEAPSFQPVEVEKKAWEPTVVPQEEPVDPKPETVIEKASEPEPEPQPEPELTRVAEPKPEPVVTKTAPHPEKRKNRTLPVIISVVALLGIAIVLGFVFGWFGGGADCDDRDQCWETAERYWGQGDLQEAYEYLKKAASYIEGEDRFHMAHIQCDLGNLSKELSHYNDARYHYETCLDWIGDSPEKQDLRDWAISGLESLDGK